MTPGIMIIVNTVIPLAVILVAVYLMLRYFSKQNEKQFDFLKANQDLTRLKLESERKKDREKVIVPLRLQAYERMVLFLERISPPNILTREMQANITVGQLQAKVLSALREEYEHNMSQQLYITENCWELVKTAKEKVVQLVNTSAAKLKSDEAGIKLANEILSGGFEGKNNPVDKAMHAIKQEIKNNY